MLVESYSLDPLNYHKKEPICIHACVTVCIYITQIWPHIGHSDSSLSPPGPLFLFLLPICTLPLLCRRLTPTAATRLPNRVFLQVCTHRVVRPIVGPHGNSSITQNTVLGASSFALSLTGSAGFQCCLPHHGGGSVHHLSPIHLLSLLNDAARPYPQCCASQLQCSARAL